MAKVNWDDDIPKIWKNHPNVPVTTNQDQPVLLATSHGTGSSRAFGHFLLAPAARAPELGPASLPGRRSPRNAGGRANAPALHGTGQLKLAKLTCGLKNMTQIVSVE